MNKQQLAAKIWKAADDLRGKIDASEYKNYILGFIFYKFLSDKQTSHLLDEGATPEDIKGIQEHSDEAKSISDQIGYFIEYKNLFSTWISLGSDFHISHVRDALNSFDRLLGQTHKRLFERIFDTLEKGLSKLGDTATSQTSTARNLIHIINEIPIDSNQDYDVLGYVYEYLIGNFAAGAGKKAGEFYTPHEVSVMMSELVAHHLRDAKDIKIYDPTSGSGSLLITIGKSISKTTGNINRVKYYAQELIELTFDLTRMNLIMRGIFPDNLVLRRGDTLDKDWPYFDENDYENTYEPLVNIDAVVSNPPYSIPWDPTDKNYDPRFRDYGVAPQSKADYAFLLHSLYHLRAGGIMTIVLPHGVLFRGGEEATIRKNLIENNNIDAIIGLPPNIFFGTGIATIIMVLKKGRTNDDVLIIDASKGFAKVGNKNKLRAQDIKKVFDVYTNRSTLSKFSRVVSRDEIRENEYNLNIPRYVDSNPAAETFDLYALSFANIPVSEISNTCPELSSFNGLFDELFSRVNDNYVVSKSSNYKDAIMNNTDVQTFLNNFDNSMTSFENALESLLMEDVINISVPHSEQEIVEKLFTLVSDYGMLDKYDLYQIFYDKWQTVVTDIEIIQTEGEETITLVVPNMVTKKKNKTNIEVQEGWMGKIIPFALVQEVYFAKELKEYQDYETDLEQFDMSIQELIELIPEEDRNDSEDNDGDEDTKPVYHNSNTKKVFNNYKKAKVAPDVDSLDDILIKIYDLQEKAKDVKKKKTDLLKSLDDKTKTRLENMSLNEGKALLKLKWISPLVSDMKKAPRTFLNDLTKKVRLLIEKYSETLSQLSETIKENEKALLAMLGELDGDEYDMQGVAELMKLLGEAKND